LQTIWPTQGPVAWSSPCPLKRPELASLLGRSLLIASFEQDKDGKQRYWEVRTTGPPGSRFYPGGYY
jgi:hypothetical protein